MPDFSSYLSPFSWRYGSDEMRRLWSEEYKRRLWRRIWIALAETESEFGLVTPEQVADLRSHADEVNVGRSLAIEAEIHHDLMAEVKAFAEQCKIGGGIIHLGATSMDIEDNADALRVRAALDLIGQSLAKLLRQFAALIEKYAETPVIAFTHLQPAEPTTLGYRLAMYAQDLLEDYEAARRLSSMVKGKGFKGAVGTSAGYAELIGVENLPEFEKRLSEKLDLPFFPVAAQTYPRRQDYAVVSALAGLAASLHKFAFDLRLLQSPVVGELSEPFGEKQVGSSAMPFKRNPIRAEKIDSLARYIAGLPRLAWDNAAHSLLERTLDDSANRRILLPESFLAADEMLRTAADILSGLRVDETAMSRNLAIYGPFAATERLLMALVKAGADRQSAHETIRAHSMSAWEAVQRGEANPLVESLCRDQSWQAFLSEAEMLKLLDYTGYIGDAPVRAREMAKRILEEVG
ncbi:MAG: adenylosuccinate lyase [Chloroflexota bacterium]